MSVGEKNILDHHMLPLESKASVSFCIIGYGGIKSSAIHMLKQLNEIMAEHS